MEHISAFAPAPAPAPDQLLLFFKAAVKGAGAGAKCRHKTSLFRYSVWLLYQTKVRRLSEMKVGKKEIVMFSFSGLSFLLLSLMT